MNECGLGERAILGHTSVFPFPLSVNAQTTTLQLVTYTTSSAAKPTYVISLACILKEFVFFRLYNQENLAQGLAESKSVAILAKLFFITFHKIYFVENIYGANS